MSLMLLHDNDNNNNNNDNNNNNKYHTKNVEHVVILFKNKSMFRHVYYY